MTCPWRYAGLYTTTPPHIRASKMYSFLVIFQATPLCVLTRCYSSLVEGSDIVYCIIPLCKTHSSVVIKTFLEIDFGQFILIILVNQQEVFELTALSDELQAFKLTLNTPLSRMNLSTFENCICKLLIEKAFFQV